MTSTFRKFGASTPPVRSPRDRLVSPRDRLVSPREKAVIAALSESDPAFVPSTRALGVYKALASPRNTVDNILPMSRSENSPVGAKEFVPRTVDPSILAMANQTSREDRSYGGELSPSILAMAKGQRVDVAKSQGQRTLDVAKSPKVDLVVNQRPASPRDPAYEAAAKQLRLTVENADAAKLAEANEALAKAVAEAQKAASLKSQQGQKLDSVEESVEPLIEECPEQEESQEQKNQRLLDQYRPILSRIPCDFDWKATDSGLDYLNNPLIKGRSVYISGDLPARDRKMLLNEGITHIVNAAAEIVDNLKEGTFFGLTLNPNHVKNPNRVVVGF